MIVTLSLDPGLGNSGVTRHVTAPALHNSVTAHCRLMRMTGWLQVIMRLSVEGLVFTLRHDNITFVWSLWLH